jgi:hypothetical protein
MIRGLIAAPKGGIGLRPKGRAGAMVNLKAIVILGLGVFMSAALFVMIITL